MRYSTVAYSGSLLIATLSMCFERFLVSVGNTIAIGKINLLLLLLNALLDYLLVQFMGLPGIGLATTLVFLCQSILFFLVLAKQQWFPARDFLLVFIKLVLAFSLTLCALLMLSNNYPANIFNLFLMLAAAYIAMFLSATVLRLPIAGSVLSSSKAALSKHRSSSNR
jgi:Na+-driven multidrug efflux pump